MQYEVALMFTIIKMEQQNTSSKEGVEILENVPFEDEVLGKGQYTSKVYHLQRYLSDLHHNCWDSSLRVNLNMSTSRSYNILALEKKE